MTSDSKISPVAKRIDSFLLVVLLASLSLNVYLGWKLRQAGPTSGVQQNIVRLPPGTKVDPVTAVSTEGNQKTTISYDAVNKPTVFYVISPSCVWCERNNENIDQLTRLKGNDFRFVGLSLADAGLKEYVEKHRFNFPIYTNLTSETIQALGLGSTPQTIVVSPEGRIIKNWTGAYNERVQPQVEEYFQIRLPGLSSGSH